MTSQFRRKPSARSACRNRARAPRPCTHLLVEGRHNHRLVAVSGGGVGLISLQVSVSEVFGRREVRIRRPERGGRGADRGADRRRCDVNLVRRLLQTGLSGLDLFPYKTCDDLPVPEAYIFVASIVRQEEKIATNCVCVKLIKSFAVPGGVQGASGSELPTRLSPARLP